MLSPFLQNFDNYFFEKINMQWHNSFFDAVIPWYRDMNTWIPLYVFLLAFMLINFGKKAWIWILFVIILISLSDQISSHFLKEWVDRVRPCNDPVWKMKERFLLSYRPQSGSFPSSHACNHFALGIFFFLTLKKYFKKWVWLFIFWAASISYGQVYVGVHYPLDIIGGAIIGSAIGYFVYLVFSKYFEMPDKKDKIPDSTDTSPKTVTI